MDPLIVLENFNSSLAKSEFKDKLGRVFQYACRGISGFLNETGTGSKDTLETLKLTQSSFADARRLNRFFKELAVGPSISFDDPDEVNRYLTVGSKVSLVLFFIIDHMAMLQKWKFVNGQAGDTIKLAMKFFTLAQIANLAIQIKKLKEEMDNEGTPKFSKARKDAATMGVIKTALLVLQGLHVSGTIETRDSIVGAAGVFTSFLDLQAMWPAIKGGKKE